MPRYTRRITYTFEAVDEAQAEIVATALCNVGELKHRIPYRVLGETVRAINPIAYNIVGNLYSLSPTPVTTSSINDEDVEEMPLVDDDDDLDFLRPVDESEAAYPDNHNDYDEDDSEDDEEDEDETW